jgi:hypothetical protein
MFLSFIQGLGFQFAIARLPIALIPEAERALAMYLQAITAAADAAERAHAIRSDSAPQRWLRTEQ